MPNKPVWRQDRCLRCAMCVGACPKGALRLGNSGITLDPSVCIVCNRCSDSCPTGSFGGE